MHVPLPTVHTPLHVHRFRALLAKHPQPAFRSFIVEGLSNGFAIGHAGTDVHSIAPNLPSSHMHFDYISDYLAQCCADGQTAGPFSYPPFPAMQCSGLGVVPKKNGKLRVIHHLSAPEGRSVNDGISRQAFSLNYIRVDDAIAIIQRIGQGALLTKLDIRNAFRLVPVRPADWHLLGIHWDGQFFFEKVLPFGLRSSPYIFDKVATAIEWIIRNEFSIPDLLHYLDDFLSIARPAQSVATQQRDIIVQAFAYLQVPLALEKLEGPTTSLTFLGITLDTIRLEARLPADKLSELRGLVEDFSHARTTSAAQFASFLGKLSFAASVIVPGRTFTRRLWDFSSRFSKVPSHYRIVLNDECRQDLRWWRHLLREWNGKAFFLYSEHTIATELGLYTDASGAIGWGAYYGRQGRWIQGKWSGEAQPLSIEYKELFAIVAACSTWGQEWGRLRLVVNCDNKAVVDCLASGTSKSPTVMCLLRKLFFVCAKHNFMVVARHVPGRTNSIADALSRFAMPDFRRLAPLARTEPDIPVPLPMLD